MLVAENDLKEKCFISKLTSEEIKKLKRKNGFVQVATLKLLSKVGKLIDRILLIKPVKLVIYSRKMNQKNT